MGMIEQMMQAQASKMMSSGEPIRLPPIAVDCAVCVIDRRAVRDGADETPADPVRTAVTVILGTPVCATHGADVLHVLIPDVTP